MLAYYAEFSDEAGCKIAANERAASEAESFGGASRTCWLGEAAPRRTASRLAAHRLQRSGYDVRAASDDAALVTLPDKELLRFASTDGRALVTENVSDFDRIVRAWATGGERHPETIFASTAALPSWQPRIPSQRCCWPPSRAR